MRAGGTAALNLASGKHAVANIAPFLYVFASKNRSMGKLVKMDVLIVGLRGLGVEIGEAPRRFQPRLRGPIT